MNIIIQDNLIQISDNHSDILHFLTNITQEYESFKDNNIVIDISNFNIVAAKDLNVFLPLIKQHSKNKKSFVIVANAIDFNKVSDKINAVPTVQEALDLIEMEEIERDLGF